MRKYVLLAGFAIVLFGASMANAQASKVLGGFKAVSNTDAAARKAAVFAVETEAKRADKEIEFISIVKAERQAVAGSKYRMCLKVSDSGAEGQDAAEVYVMVTVTVDLKGVHKLLTYEASDCGEAEDDN